MSSSLLRHVRYSAPAWVSHLVAPKHGRVLLGHLPTPVMPWACPALSELNVQWFIKRDDMSGVEMSGNKVRKLEFLMAEALAHGADCIVTCGGVQSNHCRATVSAARLLGLEAHLLLLVSDSKLQEDPGMEGNLLIDRLLGAKLHLCSSKDYLRYGGDLEAMDKLNNVVAQQLRDQGRKPYVVPVGGTTPMSAWAYINAVEELCEQLAVTPGSANEFPFDHIVFAAGSGGTATGLAVGLHSARVNTSLHAVNIQHTPDAYFRNIGKEAAALGCTPDRDGTPAEWLQIHNGAGAGYGHSSSENLRFIADVARRSGVVLDHAYTGKALYYFCEQAKAEPDRYRNKKILFWHTGGLLALYSKASLLQTMLPTTDTLRFQPP